MDEGRLGGINKRLGALEQAQRKAGTSDVNLDAYRFRICATDPPSTSIVVRSGQGWSQLGNMQFTPATVFDLSEYASTYRNSLFSIPYAYTFYWLAMATNGSQLIVGGGSTTAQWWSEHETAIEAETEAMRPGTPQLYHGSPWDNGVPIGCIILRNDGNITIPNQFMPIDPVNRRRSYIWWTHNGIAPRNFM